MDFVVSDQFPSTYIGNSVSPGAGAFTYGAWAEVTSGLAHDVTAVFLHHGVALDAASKDCYLDIGVGPSGSEVVILDGLAYRETLASWSVQGFGPIPLSIPKGTRIAIRCIAADVSMTGVILMQFLSGGLWQRSGVNAYQHIGQGAMTTGSGAWGSWVEVTSATLRSTKFLFVKIGTSGTYADYFAFVQIGFGPSGSEQLVAELTYIYRPVASGPTNPLTPICMPWSIPKGMRIAVRAGDDGGAGGKSIVAEFYGGY